MIERRILQLAFGAVTESIGLNYYEAQNVAGMVQIGICLAGGSCGTGYPLFQYPFGDQANDAAFIQRGHTYEALKAAGICPP